MIIGFFYTVCMHDTRSAVNVKGQEIKGQGHSMTVMRAVICNIINNLAGNCSIFLKFCTDFDRMSLGVQRSFKINGSEVKVTA